MGTSVSRDGSQAKESAFENVIVNVNNLTVQYGANNILKDLTFHVLRGEFTSVIGPSGCGKSTLLNAIAGFVRPSAGEIVVGTHTVQGPGRDRGVVFQDLALFPWLNVIDNVAFALRVKGMSKQTRYEKAHAMLEIVGLADKKHSRIKDLSGGMKQRVALARTLVMEPDILLMDEPFSALDAQTRDVLQDELLRIQRNTHTTVIFITHNIDEAIYLSDRVFLMDGHSGGFTDILDIDLKSPREPEVRTTPRFNQYKRYLMEHLRVQNQIHR